MISGKGNYNNNASKINNGSPIRGVNKSAFERNFPSLVAEERRAELEIGRVPSPVSLLVGPSPVIGGDGWTSALAEVPVIVGSNGSGTPMVHVGSNTNASGLNMSATVAQSRTRVQTSTQVSVETQRLEELAIKQSRQLIHVVSSAKTLVLNSSDKTKPKVSQHQHQILSSLSPHSSLTKPDIAKTANTGKLLILKPARERNGNSPIVKDNLSPTSGSKSLNTPFAVAPAAVGFASSKNSSSHPILTKPTLPILEKRPGPQAQSRNDFFNLMRKKSLTNSPSLSSPSASCEATEPESDVAQVQDEPGGGQFIVGRGESSPSVNGGDGASDMLENGKKDLVSDIILLPLEEEEAAFLRSLGWDKNGGEEGGLTEEEIKAFKEHYMDRKNLTPPSRN